MLLASEITLYFDSLWSSTSEAYCFLGLAPLLSLWVYLTCERLIYARPTTWLPIISLERRINLWTKPNSRNSHRSFHQRFNARSSRHRHLCRRRRPQYIYLTPILSPSTIDLPLHANFSCEVYKPAQPGKTCLPASTKRPKSSNSSQFIATLCKLLWGWKAVVVGYKPL